MFLHFRASSCLLRPVTSPGAPKPARWLCEVLSATQLGHENWPSYWPQCAKSKLQDSIASYVFSLLGGSHSAACLHVPSQLEIIVVHCHAPICETLHIHCGHGAFKSSFACFCMLFIAFGLRFGLFAIVIAVGAAAFLLGVPDMELM